MKITVRDAPPRSVWALQQAGVHPLLAQLFAARGVLSHHHGVDPGAYGFLTDIAIDKVLLKAALAGRAPLRIRFAVSGGSTHPGGFTLYGDRLGCFPVAPTLFLLTG